jgi:hypothetical protein
VAALRCACQQDRWPGGGVRQRNRAALNYKGISEQVTDFCGLKVALDFCNACLCGRANLSGDLLGAVTQDQKSIGLQCDFCVRLAVVVGELDFVSTIKKNYGLTPNTKLYQYTDTHIQFDALRRAAHKQ